MTRHNHFVKEFMFDDEQRQFLLELYDEYSPLLKRAGVYDSKSGHHFSHVRKCTNVPVDHKHIPDISLEMMNWIDDLDPDYPEDLWFAQYEFICYEGAGQTFLRHSDDDPNGESLNRLYTSVTMIEKSDDLIGGKLIIWTPDGNEYTIDLQPFETVIFPAWFEHEATPLIQGKRVILISWAQRLVSC